MSWWRRQFFQRYTDLSYFNALSITLTLSAVNVVSNESNLLSNSSSLWCDPVKTKKSVCSWGAGSLGQLGLGTQKDIFTPTVIKTFEELNESINKLSCYGNKSLFLTESGKVYFNGTGFETNELKNTIPTEILVPKESIREISIGFNHAALISNSNKLYTFGDGYFGQLGLGSTVKSSEVPIFISDQFARVACGDQFTLAIDVTGDAYSFGVGRAGSLGQGNYKKVDEITRVEFFVENKIKLQDVACGKDFSLFLTTDGKLYSCGANDYGQLGTGVSDRKRNTPKLISTLANETIVKISTGEYHSAVLSKNGKVYTFGLGNDGQCGHDSRSSIYQPTLVKDLNEKVISLNCGGGHTAAITASNKLFVWGRGRNGQLGSGDNVESVAANRNTPHFVEALKSESIAEVACGADHTIVLCQ